MLFLLFCFLSVNSHGTTFINRPLGDVVKETPNIVRGRAGDSYSEWDKSGRKSLYTYTRLDITEVLKGGIKENQITMRQPGGSKDGTEMNVPGTAHFNVDEEVVVMLGERNKEDDSYDVPGFTTGKYNLITAENGELALVNSLGGAAVYDPEKDPNTLSYNSKIPLEVFRRVAKGDDIPEAAHRQFQQSEKSAPKTAYDANNHGHVSPQVTPTVKPQASSEPTSENPPKETKWWIPMSFLILALLGIGFILKLM
jgi:hypothetical protein